MLKDIITGKEDWKFAVIEDSHRANGVDLISCFIKEHIKSGYDIRVVSYDHPKDYFSQILDPTDYPNITHIDGYCNPTNWTKNDINENRLTVKTDLLECFESLRDSKSTQFLIVIDSLSRLLLHRNVRVLCQTIDRIQKIFEDSGKKVRILGLLHCDIHRGSVVSNVEYIASTIVKLLANDNDEITCDVTHRKNKKTTAKKIYFRITSTYELEQFEKLSAVQTVDSTQVDPTAGLTFKLNLEDKEKTAREELVLPYIKGKGDEVQLNSEIIYEYDSADDFDEEDPDDDLNI